MLKNIFISILFFVAFTKQFSFGQLITNSGQNPGSLVQNILLGPGVTASNISYNGSPSAMERDFANKLPTSNEPNNPGP